MKVLFLIDTLAVGGAERSLLEILSRLQHTQPVMCHIYSQDSLKAEYEAAGVPVVCLNVPDKYHFGIAVRRVVSLIRQLQPDLVHTTLFRADMVGRVAGRITGIPVIGSFVNESYHAERKRNLSPLGRGKLMGVQLADALTARFACHFVAVAESCKQENCRALRIDPRKVSVIYRGRDIQALDSVTDAQVKSVRRQLHLCDGQPLILSVGRLLCRKGHADLVRAMPAVLAQFPATRLAIAGEGHDRDRLQSVINSLDLHDRVMLLGARNDIPVLLQVADLFVFPSHYEGHPGALVEAMLAGRPIVASDIPVHGEMISHGESGLLANTRDPKSIASAICELLRNCDMAQHMGHHARADAIRRFDIRAIARQYDTLYASLLSQTLDVSV